MTRLTFFITAISILLTAFSCGNKTLPSKSNTDTVRNDDVQPTFLYGIYIGETITNESIISHLSSKGLIFLERASNEHNLKFSSNKGTTISNEGLTFQNLMIKTENGKINGIEFFNSYNEEKAAKQNYELLQNVICAKRKATARDSKTGYRTIFFKLNDIKGVIRHFTKDDPSEGTIYFNVISYRIINL